MSYDDYLLVYDTVHEVMVNFLHIKLCLAYDKEGRESLCNDLLSRLTSLEKVCDDSLLNMIRSLKAGICSFVFYIMSHRDRIGIAIELDSLADCISKVCIEGLESYGIWV